MRVFFFGFVVFAVPFGSEVGSAAGLGAVVDGLWFVGGLGCAVILVTALVRRTRAGTPDLLPVLWVAAACLSVAVNGSRGLPQYFLQAAPALALAFGVAAAWSWPRLRPITRGLAVIAVAVAVQRVVNVDKIVDYLQWEVSAWTGSRSREDYLARFGGRDSGDKYRRSPCASWRS